MSEIPRCIGQHVTWTHDDGSQTFGVGRLGATITAPAHSLTSTLAHGAQLGEIERRILRIEMALRRAGIEVEEVAFLA